MRIVHFFIAMAIPVFAAQMVSAEEVKDRSPDAGTDAAVTELLEQLKNLKTDYEADILELESRITELEKTKIEENNESELQKLLQEAQDLKGKGMRKRQRVGINRVFRGSERQQSQLNPEISLTGDFNGSYSSSNAAFIEDTGDFTDGRNQFNLREAELNVVAPLDPFTRGKFFFGIPGTGEASLSEMIEEAYMEWLNLPAGMNLKIGLFNTQFGILNRWHDHGLPQVDRPRELTNLFGTANFGGIGVSGNFLLPRLCAHVNELDIEVITGGEGVSFDDSYDNVIGVAHFKNYYDLTRNTYMEIGFSGAYGKSANIYSVNTGDYVDYDYTTLAGIDVAYKWVPAGRSHYRTTEFRSEFFFSRREKAADNLNSFGFYSFITNKMGPRFWVGLRYSYSGMPWYTVEINDTMENIILKDEYEWDISPTIDFWQSEFVMLRLQYSYTKRSNKIDNKNANDHSIFLQTVWSMGPHKHEAY